MKNNIINSFTVDVEDYFQVEAFSQTIDRKDWGAYESRVVNNTIRILDLLDAYNTSGTFFVLGWVAKRNPELVREIDSRGHEVASHGMSHKLIYNQTQDEFRQETIDSKKLLEDIIQKEVRGYRAATYSITKKSFWALDILCEAGYKYDSSIFPILHDRYGIADINTKPHVITTPSNNRIVEFPISVFKNKIFNVPISGGGYFRLFPYGITKYLLGLLNRKNLPFMFYIHPWEVDPHQPEISNIKLSTKFRHYNNISRCEDRLGKLLGDFKFSTTSDVLNQLELL